MTYRELLEALLELPAESLEEEVKVVRGINEVFELCECILVDEIGEPALKQELVIEYNLPDEYPILLI